MIQVHCDYADCENNEDKENIRCHAVAFRLRNADSCLTY